MNVSSKKASFSFAFFFIMFAIFLFVLFTFELANISISEEPIFAESSKVRESVEIYKNKYGIPQVIAPDLSDAMFGVGFAQASDRLWQMDYLRRVARGELAEILGSKAIRFDQYFRSLQLKEASEIVLKNIDSLSLLLLESFSNGVNLFIEKNLNKLPIEFQALDYKPKPWTPLDCILIGRLLGFTMNFSFWLDLTYFDILNRIGVAKTFELLPNKVESINFFHPDSILHKFYAEDTLVSVKNETHNLLYSSGLSEIQQFFPYLSNGLGSNTWVVQHFVDGRKKCILASDPHLKLALPPIWYQIHITTSKFNVIGLCIPGIPLPLIGRNDYITWGITNGMIDDCDFFIHKLDSSKKFINNTLKKVRIIFKTDTIKVKNSIDFVYYQRYVGKDIIISDFLLLKDSVFGKEFYGIKNSPLYPDSIVLTFDWTGKHFSNEIRALYQICSAKNWNEFVEAKKFWGTPVLNFSYADTKGNFGLMLAGITPIRHLINPNFPTHRDEGAWLGFQSLGNEFNLYNPSEGFVFNANNKTFNSTTYLSNYWSDPSRAFRIYRLLKGNKPEDVLSIQVMQHDKFSEQASFVLKIILPVLENEKTKLNELEKKALNKLQNWNYIFSENYVSPSIYQIFLVKFLENTLKDELGEPLFRQFLYLDFIATRKFLELISDSISTFYDDVRTNAIETKTDIIVKSFKDAVAYLQQKISNDINKWTYSRWHKLKLEHPFAAIKFLEPSFSMDEIPVGGHNSTINYSGSKLFTPEKVEVGPSARFIADMGDTLVYWILPGGNSGQNMSKNYSDQYQLWLSGGYINMSMSKVPDNKFRLFAKIRSRKF